MQHKKTLHLLTRKIRLKNFISGEYAKISKENSLALNNCNTGSYTNKTNWLTLKELLNVAIGRPKGNK